MQQHAHVLAEFAACQCLAHSLVQAHHGQHLVLLVRIAGGGELVVVDTQDVDDRQARPAQRHRFLGEDELLVGGVESGRHRRLEHQRLLGVACEVDVHASDVFVLRFDRWNLEELFFLRRADVDDRRYVECARGHIERQSLRRRVAHRHSRRHHKPFSILGHERREREDRGDISDVADDLQIDQRVIRVVGMEWAQVVAADGHRLPSCGQRAGIAGDVRDAVGVRDGDADALAVHLTVQHLRDCGEREARAMCEHGSVRPANRWRDGDDVAAVRLEPLACSECPDHSNRAIGRGLAIHPFAGECIGDDD